MGTKSKLRTTVTLDKDVAAAVANFRRERDVGFSEAINELIRSGLVAPKKRRPFVQKTRPLGLKVEIDNVERALDDIEGPMRP